MGPQGERIVYGDYTWERLPGRSATRVLALGSVRAFPAYSGVLVGGGARIGSDLLPLHAWAIDMMVESGTIGTSRGVPLNVDNWSLGATLSLVSELRRNFMARAGAGLRAGLTRGTDVGSGSRVNFPVFWGWPMLALSVSGRFGDVAVELGAEGGYATLPEGPGSGNSARGVWLNAQLGIGLALGQR
ncbi:MAG: hypothetical protein QM756_34190 [Polyangiaceae bacterium]